MKYLYDKVSKQIDEMIKKNHKTDIDMDILQKNLPLKMRLTRYDVISIVKELEIDGKYVRKGDKLKRR